MERQALGTDWSPVQLSVIAVFTVAFLGGLRTSNRSYHGFLAIGWLVACIAWGIAGLNMPIVTP